jgi:hypothetical protein
MCAGLPICANETVEIDRKSSVDFIIPCIFLSCDLI